MIPRVPLRTREESRPPFRASHNVPRRPLAELAKDKVYQFAFVFSPLRLKGATGSPGNPIAIR